MATLPNITGKERTFVGDWVEISEMFAKFPSALRLEAMDLMTIMADAVLARLTAAIKDQIYTWTPLTAAYAKEKEEKKLDPRILIATGGYIEAFKVTSTKTAVFAGVPNDPLPSNPNVTFGLLGNWLEYGTDRMPARPHYAPAFFELPNYARIEIEAYGFDYLGIVAT